MVLLCNNCKTAINLILFSALYTEALSRGDKKKEEGNGSDHNMCNSNRRVVGVRMRVGDIRDGHEMHEDF